MEQHISNNSLAISKAVGIKRLGNTKYPYRFYNIKGKARINSNYFSILNNIRD
jgi:hypothetical protein